MSRHECDCGVVYHNLEALYACQANNHYQPVKYCKLPHEITGKEAKIYRSILHMHCSADDKDSPDHQCQGAITISNASLVARCKRCGDCKGQLP